MKKVIILLSVLLVSMVFFNACAQDKKNGTFEPVVMFPEPPRPAGQTDVMELRCDPIDTVRIAFIGIGNRGIGAVKRYTHIEGVKIKVLCDLVDWHIERAQDVLVKAGLPKADTYTGEFDYKKICERNDIDLVYIDTDWAHHTPIAVYALNHGKHAVTEVPSAITIDECWQLVNASEKNRRHFMQLENCVYDFFEMAEHRMAEEGVFGEIVHVEGAYIHDLRHHNFETDPHKGGYWNMWRLEQNATRNGNLYPTHGFGPLCHLLNIHRGDRMEYVVSLSSDQFGMTDYAINKFGKDSDFAKREYKNGDMNTSLIRTANGKTMMIQHDVSNPRPYSRIQLVSGTKGYACKYPVQMVALDTLNGDYRGHLEPMEGEKLQKILKKYEHPIVKEIGEEAKKVGGHGGMDFIMDYRLIYCLRNGLPLDQDVYDAAEWSALAELSEKSVANHGMSIKYPDFTRGAWKKLKKVTYYHK
jgi:predicted dehydrogenase